MVQAEHELCQIALPAPTRCPTDHLDGYLRCEFESARVGGIRRNTSVPVGTHIGAQGSSRRDGWGQ